MNILRAIQDSLIRRQYKRLSHALATATSRQMLAEQDRAVLKAFHRAAREVPAYGRLLDHNGVDPREITTVDHFRQKVPILDKKSVFASHELRDLCVGGSIDDISLFYSSSGHSKSFSFGVETWADAGRLALETEFALQEIFQALDRKTLLINALPMGVRIYTRTVPQAQTSVRSDVILALIEKLRGDFDQFILIAEHLFLKKVIEDGVEQGISWKDLNVHVLTGAEYIAENFRTYLAALLGVDFDRPETGTIIINFGLSELSPSIFRENIQTLRLRRLIHDNPDLCKALCGWEAPICPTVMQLSPGQCYAEAIPGPEGRSELVVTVLSQARKMPIIRYNTGDVVELLAYDEFATILADFDLGSLIPPCPLPIALIWGKLQTLQTPQNQKIYSESVKEALYSVPPVAQRMTGAFRLQNGDDAPELLLQLKPGVADLDAFLPDLEDSLRRFSCEPLQVRTYPYANFPCDGAGDFESKNRYL